MEISAAISSFVTHVKVEKGLSVNTVSAYRRDLAKFEGFAKKRKLALETVSRDDLVDFLAGLYRREAGEPDGGAASGHAAEFLPFRADSGADHRAIRR